MIDRCIRGLAGVFAALALALVITPAGAETRHALIVAVNNYPALGEDAALSGPANDAELTVGYLTRTPELDFDPANITVLANGGVASKGDPTRQAILDAMTGLSRSVAPGDFVYIQFAGHGSRQKARDPATETDGLDEIFLPSDTQEPRDGIYPNALVDDDIGDALDAIRAAGAFVFIVFDSCHSSTATRNAGAEPANVRYRWMPEPAGAVEAASPAAEPLREPSLSVGDLKPRAEAGAAGMVAFFAAQTIETTPELPLPLDAETGKTYGLFSYTLLDVIAKHPGATYREIAGGVMHAYAAGNFDKPTPLFEGDLDHVVFGLDQRPSVLSWPVEVESDRVSIAAGALHGLEKDAVLALLPDPLAGDDAALGYVRVRTDDPLSAEATPIRYGGKAVPLLSELSKGVFARIAETPLSFELRVALPSGDATRFADAVAYARGEIEKAASDVALPANLKLVQPGASADLDLVVASEAELYPGSGGPDTPRLWFLPPGGQLSTDPRFKPHSIGLDGGMSDEQRQQMRENFVAVFRATSLAQLSSLSEIDRKKVGFGLELRKANADGPISVDGSAIPVMSPGDQLVFNIRNDSSKAIDVDMLLIGPNYAIKHMLGRRFQRGDGLKGALGDIADAGFGLWRLVLVMRETKRNSFFTDLSFLNQIGTQTRAGANGGTRDFPQLLEDIAGGAQTRGATRSGSRNALKGSLEIFSLEALPAN